MGSRPESSAPPPSTAGAPEVRARHPQTLLKHTRAAAPTAYPAILAALGAGTRAALDASIPVTWLPITLDVEVVEAIAERLGPAATASLIESRQREEMGSALFDSFVKMGMRVFGASPMTMVKRIPAGWRQLFRNVGTVEVVSTGDAEAEALFLGLPAPCIASEAWMAALPVGLCMLYELVRVKGTVTCRIEDAARGNARVTFRWR